jgi:PAS domain S-box-containing protein
MTNVFAPCPNLEILRRQLGFVDADAKFFSELFERTPEAMLVIDDRGRVHAANDAACRLHLVDRYELLRLRIQDLLPTKLNLGNASKSLRDRGEAALEFTEMAGDGTETSLRLEAKQFHPHRYLVSFRDVTSERKLERDLGLANDRLKFGDAAAMVVHDVNNLLSPIACYADALAAREPMDAELAAIVAEMREAAHRAASLTRKLLSLARPPAEGPCFVQMNDVLEKMKSILARIVGQHIELVLDLDLDLATVNVDAEELERLVLNLVLNARDAMPNGGRLALETSNVARDLANAERRYAVLAVTDTGVGMDARTRERIFEPFFTTKAAGAGTGLGLSNALSLVRCHRGYVEVDTELGHGTTFRIGFPECLRAPKG